MIPAAKWGAITGIVTYLVVAIVLTVVGNLLFGTGAATLEANPGKLAFGCLSIFLLLFAFSAAGFFTGRETLRGGLGALSGMVAFAIYAALFAIYSPGGGGVAAATPAPNSPANSAVAQAIGLLAALVVLLLIAAMMGWLGGRPGAQRARKRAGLVAIEKATAP